MALRHDQQGRAGRHRTHADDQVHRAVGLEGSAASREVRPQRHARRIPSDPKDVGKKTATSKEAANFAKRKPWRPPQPAATDKD